MLKKLKALAVVTVAGFFLTATFHTPRTAAVQQPEPSKANSPEGLEFFEKKIRPILADNCYACHSERSKKPQGDLRIDLIESLLRGGASGKPAVVPGDPEKSLLILAVRQTDAKLQMPPGDKLTPEQIKDLEQWIKMGAPAPPALKDKNAAATVNTYDWNEAKKFWSFQPVKSVEPPPVKNPAWVKSPIDRFVLAKLEEKGLKPIGDADKLTLIRRATFDLTGLPPTPEEIDAFLADKASNAFEAVVDRLLASPAYGEKWGRHWLDVVRYADTAGDNSDYPVPAAYRYRNYVIESFNRDKPYDQFVREQIAGDLLPSANDKEKYEKIIATGYVAMSRRFGSRNENMNLTIDDTIDNLGKAFLGLSTACARCHDHKFDPIPTRDYYALYGIFNSSRYSFPGAEIYKHPAEYVALAGGEKAARFYRQQQELNDLDDWHEFLVAEKGTAARNKKAKEQQAKEAAQPVAAVPAEKERKADAAKANNQTNDRTLEQASAAQSAAKPEPPKTTLTGYPLRPADFNRDADNWGRAGQSKRMPEENDAEMKRVSARIQELHAHMVTVDKAYAVVEGLPKNARIHRRGEPKNPGDEVPRGFLTILGGQKVPDGYQGSGRDLLARWIADAKNPLTARVMVNRVWEYHFGKGLVQTPNDFGTRGKAPTHPELLDWLAARFIADGWSLKKMHKLMMLSHAYQLSSRESVPRAAASGLLAANEKIDVNNDYLWRFNRRRLEAEEIRDSILAVAGTLDRSVGGEHPFPPETAWKFTQHEQFFAVYDTNRRSVYVMQQRLKKHPFFEVFDGADQSATTDVRGQSITPVQALFLMNSPLMHEQSDHFAVRVGMAFDTVAERINYAFRLAYGRAAALPEIKEAAAYLQQTRQELATANTPMEKLNRAALASYLRVVLGSNEFLYVD